MRNAVIIKQRSAGQMRHLSVCLTDPDVDGSFAKVDRHQLSMKVGDVNERDVAERFEIHNVRLAQLLLSKGPRPATRHDRRRRGDDLEKLAPRRHREATNRSRDRAAAKSGSGVAAQTGRSGISPKRIEDA